MNIMERFLQRPIFGESGALDSVAFPNGFLYISLHSITAIYWTSEDKKEPLVKVFMAKQPIHALDVDPGWNEAKLFATLTAEDSILIWDFDKNYAINGHKVHCTPKRVEGASGKGRTKLVHLSFLKNRNLLSLSPTELVVYCIASNSTWVRPNFIKGHVTALKCSPYDDNIFACGTAKGDVNVCDLQKLNILFNFRNHQTPVVSLAWNAIELVTKEKKLVKSAAVTISSTENEDIFNIYDYDYLEHEFGAPINPMHFKAEDRYQESTELSLNPNFNFTEACESLKQEINALNESENKIEETSGCDAVTLADCQQTKNVSCQSSDGGSNESTEGSLEKVEPNNSSDDSCHVDGKNVDLLEQNVKVNQDNLTSNVEEAQTPLALEKPKMDIILASMSTDGQIYVYNTITGSYCDRFKSSKATPHQGCKVFWKNATDLIILKNSTLIYIKLKEIRYTTADTLRQYKLDTFEHNLFKNISSFSLQSNDDNELLWYIKSNRIIACMNLKTRKEIFSHEGVTSSMHAMCECPHNNLKIALGLANTSIALLDTQQLSETNSSLQYISARLISCVKIFAWHANGEDLAYGTINGHVGIVNIETQKHTTFRNITSRCIFSLSWRNDQLFFINNEKVCAYAIEFRDPLIIEGISGPHSFLSVYQTFLICGSTRGYIEIYREKTTENTTPKCLSFDMIQRLEVAKHYITDISFNPIETEQFAVLANEAYVYLLNFNATGGTAEMTNKLGCGSPKALIYKVKWSNRDAKKLVTCGSDGGLRIFDLSRPESEQLYYVKQFHCPLLTAMFLPTNERYVLCTGKTITIEVVDTEKPLMEINSSKSDRSLEGIRWATQPTVNQTAFGNNKRKQNKKALPLANVENEKSKAAIDEELIEKVSKIDLIEKPGTITGVSTDVAKYMPKFLKSPATILTLLAKEQNKNPLLKIHEFITLATFKDKRTAVMMSRLFGEKIDAEKLLVAELANLKATGSSAPEISTIVLNQMTGGLKDHIQNAIQARELSEWHISLAPSISYRFWQKCCQAFAEQLLEQGYPLQAASYLLTMHKQLDAIQMLLSANYFKEAMLLGRVYLYENDPLLQEITDKWINNLESQGNLPAAALICTVSKQYQRGYEILAKQRVMTPEVQAAITLLKEMG